MRDLWSKVTPEALGFPRFPVEGCLPLTGKAVAWLPGMKASGTADWYFITMHTGDIKRYAAAGGDMQRAVIHHLTYDSGVINPLWGSHSFKKRVERMKSLGIKNVVAPDFSSWADFPVAVQLHNYYRSLVVACDFVLAGFKVLPLVCWSAPQIAHISIKAWPTNASTICVDATHLNTVTSSFNQELFWHGARELKQSLEYGSLYLWANSENVVRRWQREIGSAGWIPSRAFMLNKLCKLKKEKN